MFERDNLSGIPKAAKYHWFVVPGKVILWMAYMFPSGAYAKTRQSARWARSPIMTVILSSIFWITIIVLVLICIGFSVGNG